MANKKIVIIIHIMYLTKSQILLLQSTENRYTQIRVGVLHVSACKIYRFWVEAKLKLNIL